MTNFYICRHGETENNRKKRLQGWIDTPLTTEGAQNPVASGNKLKGKQIDLVVSSDLGRAFVSAYIAARVIGYAGEIVREPGFRENNYGELANSRYEDVPVIGPEQYADHIFPGGESPRHMHERVLATLDRVANANDGLSILIVAHDGTINAIRARFKNMDVYTADQITNPHDFVAQFSYANGAIADFREVTEP